MFVSRETSNTVDQSYPWAQWEGWKPVEDSSGWETPGFVEHPTTGDRLKFAHAMPPEYVPGLKRLVENFMATSQPLQDTSGCPCFNYFQNSRRGNPPSVSQIPAEVNALRIEGLMMGLLTLSLMMPRRPAPVQNLDVPPRAGMRLGTFNELVGLLTEKGLLNNWEQLPLFPIEYDADTAHDVIEQVFKNSAPEEKLPFIFRKSSSENCIVITHGSEDGSGLSSGRHLIYIDAHNDIHLKSLPTGLSFAPLSEILDHYYNKFTPMKREDIEKELDSQRESALNQFSSE